MQVRRLRTEDVALVAAIDRSEHVEVQYRVIDGQLQQVPAVITDVPGWDATGSGPHTVAAEIAFCSSVVARGGILLGTFDGDGFLKLKDRSKDLIISGGSNIYPREVEEALLRHADVVEAAVIGRRHDEWGEEVVACIVSRMPFADDAARKAFERTLDALCLDCIARFKRPRAYVFLSELPKNNTGKVLKTALREMVSRAKAGSADDGALSSE